MKFALLGGAGYIAGKHYEAIKAIGGELTAIYDPHDSVGVIDRYFPEAKYFGIWDVFDRHINRNPVDYIVICSPNWLHESQCRWGLNTGANVICEKPLALKTANVKAIIKAEEKTGCKVYPILQLRLHPDAVSARKLINQASHYNVVVKYSTPRGAWYQSSWKGNVRKSGGLATNIGVHLFDLVTWLFGDTVKMKLTKFDNTEISGILKLQRAMVYWELSIKWGQMERIFKVDGHSFDMSDISGLHIKAYDEIVSGRGLSVMDAMESIKIIERIKSNDTRNS